MFLAAAGLASEIITTGISIGQSFQQNELMKQADKKAAEAMSEVMKSLGVNTYDNLSINKETYKDLYDNLLASAGMSIEAGREGEERGAAATAGRVLMAQTDMAQKIRDTKAQEIMDINLKRAEEESRLRDIKAQIGLQEVEGAQQAAADAQAAKNQAITQAASGLTSMAGQAVAMAPLYMKTQASRQLTGLEKNYMDAAKSGKLAQQYYDASGNPIPFEEYLVKASGLDQNKFMKQMEGKDGAKTSVLDSYGVRDYFVNEDAQSLEELYNMGFGGTLQEPAKENKYLEMFPGLRRYFGQ
jgi:hypothetical protein